MTELEEGILVQGEQTDKLLRGGGIADQGGKPPVTLDNEVENPKQDAGHTPQKWIHW